MTKTKIIASMALALMMGLSTTSFAFSSCHRHIYNNSDAVWKIKSIPKAGDVFVAGKNCSGSNGCEAPAHSTVDIEYVPGDISTPIDKILRSRGTLQIKDKKGNQQSFNYANSGMFDTCPKIDGDTLFVKFNSPGNGDIVINNRTFVLSVRR